MKKTKFILYMVLVLLMVSCSTFKKNNTAQQKADTENEMQYDEVEEDE